MSLNSAAGRAARRQLSNGRSVGRGGGWFGQRGSSGKSIYASNDSMLSVGQNMVSGGALARNSLLRIILTMQSIFKMHSLANFCTVVFKSREQGLRGMGVRWPADAMRCFGPGSFFADVLHAATGGALTEFTGFLSAARIPVAGTGRCSRLWRAACQQGLLGRMRRTMSLRRKGAVKLLDEACSTRYRARDAGRGSGGAVRACEASPANLPKRFGRVLHDNELH